MNFLDISPPKLLKDVIVWQNYRSESELKRRKKFRAWSRNRSRVPKDRFSTIDKRHSRETRIKWKVTSFAIEMS